MRPLLGTWPATQACVLTGNRTSNPLVRRLARNPLSHTSQDYTLFCTIFPLSTMNKSIRGQHQCVPTLYLAGLGKKPLLESTYLLRFLDRAILFIYYML